MPKSRGRGPAAIMPAAGTSNLNFRNSSSRNRRNKSNAPSIRVIGDSLAVAHREGQMAKRKSLNVNGRRVSVGYDDPAMPLLYALRDDLGLKGPRFGCGLGQCGACTVHVDGAAVRSCVTPIATIGDRQVIVTLEGLGMGAKLHPLQKAFIDEQALQCGYCINGMIMQAAAFLASKKRPSEDEIKSALANNLCRCGTHSRIVRAVKRASVAT